MKKIKHKILSLDVWGNEKDGFEINDQHGTDIIVEIPENATDKEAVKILKKALGIKWKGQYVDRIQTEDGYCFDIAKTGEPAIYTVRLDN